MHAGGVLRDGSILSCNMSGVRTVYAPKANGLVNIEEVRYILFQQSVCLTMPSLYIYISFFFNLNKSSAECHEL
jgi:hypothetical protein